MLILTILFLGERDMKVNEHISKALDLLGETTYFFNLG